MTEERQGKYFVVQNLTPAIQVINPTRRELSEKGLDLIIQPYDYAEIDRDDVEKWVDDRNLGKAQERGLVRAFFTDNRPSSFPEPPESYRRASDPRLQGMIREIVIGSDSNSRDFITAEPRVLTRAGQPIDTEWIKQYGWLTLEAARDWLLSWGPPPTHKWRLDLIEQRLDQIRRMP